MKVVTRSSKTRSSKSAGKRILGFTLIECMMAVGVSGLMFTSMFAGVTQNISVVQSARESLRATQIMAEKMDTIRLYNWTQLTTPGFVKTNFTVTVESTVAAQTTSDKGNKTTPTRTAGITYEGNISIKPPTLEESYKGKMREVTIQLKWNSGKQTRQAEMKTFVSQNGMQNYVY